MIKKFKSLFLLLTIFITSFFINTTLVFATVNPACEKIFGGETEKLLKQYYPFITYGLIILFIVYTSIEAIKALSNADDKGSKNFYKRISKRIAVVCIALLIPSLIEFFFSALGLNFCFLQ